MWMKNPMTLLELRHQNCRMVIQQGPMSRRALISYYSGRKWENNDSFLSRGPKKPKLLFRIITPTALIARGNVFKDQLGDDFSHSGGPVHYSRNHSCGDKRSKPWITLHCRFMIVFDGAIVYRPQLSSLPYH